MATVSTEKIVLTSSMKDKGDHDTCSCVVDEAVAVSEVVDDEAVVCMSTWPSMR